MSEHTSTVSTVSEDVRTVVCLNSSASEYVSTALHLAMYMSSVWACNNSSVPDMRYESLFLHLSFLPQVIWTTFHQKVS